MAGKCSLHHAISGSMPSELGSLPLTQLTTNADSLSGVLPTQLANLEGGFRVCTWDPKVLVLHNGPLAATDASLDQILAACHEKPATADAPLGWVVIGLHVDD